MQSNCRNVRLDKHSLVDIQRISEVIGSEAGVGNDPPDGIKRLSSKADPVGAMVGYHTLLHCNRPKCRSSA